MKIKELKTLIEHLPDNMEIIVAGDRTDLYGTEPYTIQGRELRKGKVKLTKKMNGIAMIQSRPVKDDDISANLALIIE